MGKSRRKTPKMKLTGGRKSNKIPKRLTNRAFRRKSKITDDPENAPKDLKEVSDVWSWPSDGLAYYLHNKDPKYLRK